jgi:cob(I)alamin adenosyltransferase
VNDSTYGVYLDLCDEINALVSTALEELEPEEAEEVLERLQESFRFRNISY